MIFQAIILGLGNRIVKKKNHENEFEFKIRHLFAQNSKFILAKNTSFKQKTNSLEHKLHCFVYFSCLFDLALRRLLE